MKTTIRALAIAACGAALAAAPALAQHQHGGDTHAQHAAMASEGPSPLMALHHKQELNVTADQAARLERVNAALRQAHQRHCEEMKAAGADHQAMHARMMEAMKTADEQAAAVLTAEQRARLAALHAEHMKEHGGEHASMQHGQGEHAQHGSMQHGEGGEHGGMHAMGGDDCEEHCCKDGKCDEEACLRCCDMHREGHGEAAHSHG